MLSHFYYRVNKAVNLWNDMQAVHKLSMTQVFPE